METLERTLTEEDWDTLLGRIEQKKCTPFLGAGVNDGILAVGSEIATTLAGIHGCPFKDKSNLARVTQVLAVEKDAMFPKEAVLKLVKEQLGAWERKVVVEDFFKSTDQPLSILADLSLPIYMTTNYDDLMVRALTARQKEPQRELCRWNKYVAETPSVFDSPSGFEPTVANPVVFHLHGHDGVPESLVLTEDDYIDFLVNISRRLDLLPARIQQAMTGSSLLFIGYRLADMDFRVLFRGLVESLDRSLRRVSVAVQLPPEDAEQKKYWVDYFDEMKVRVYWGDAKKFAMELRDRWSDRNGC
jgi:hypothetical protein